MEVIPVIDLMGGEVVHARGGRRAEYRPIETPLSPTSAPADVVGGLFRLAPFRRIYIADLDAIAGDRRHDGVLDALAAAHPAVEFWIDPGIADAAGAEAWLGRHAGALVLGSETFADAPGLRTLVADPRIILSLDFRGETFQGPPALLEDPTLWPRRIIVMTLARVGSATGPDLDRLVATIARAGSRSVHAAGGVRNDTDLDALGAIGAAGALVATALHAGSISPSAMAGGSRPRR